MAIIKKKPIMDVIHITEVYESTGEVKEYQKKVYEDAEDIRLMVLNKLAERKDLEHTIDSYFGKYYFHFYNSLNNTDIPNNMKTRFLYICTYIRYDGYLYDSNHKSFMDKNYIKSILKLSDNEYFRTLKCFIDSNLITSDTNGYYMINKKYVHKGELNSSMKKLKFTRMFIDGIRNLYDNAKLKTHKQLYYLFMLLPYINLQHNVVCSNPEVEDEDLIEAYDMKDICTICGYSKNQSSRLSRELLSIKINDKYAMIKVVRGDGEFIEINPAIYYGGTRMDSLTSLMANFKYQISR